MTNGRDATAPDSCGSCGAALQTAARFCAQCGTPISRGQAEYKQVTVLFADVVHSMDIAATVGAERLREIMAELVDRTAEVVHRYGGTVDKFTGDGVMALFGAPLALEDHARRACLAALDLQRAARRLATVVAARDGLDLHLRVGLNSGEVITGEIGSGGWAYTAIGEQVGMAQRMESVAGPDQVMLSESTARLVDGMAELGEPQQVLIKGFANPVVTRRLVSAADAEVRPPRRLSTLVGRDWEVAAIGGLLDQSLAGKGRVLGLVGSPGIGKSRMVGETTALAAERGAQVFATYCESHTSTVPFHVAARLLRDVFDVRDLDDADARAVVRARLTHAEPEDLVLLDDLLGIADPDTALPDIDPDARRRRLVAMLNTAAAERRSPAIYVIEDTHWIDAVSESMIAEFAAVMPQAHALMVISYRPEYHGALDRLPGAHRISLAPLDDSDSSAMTAELLGADDSVAALATQVAARAAGNPFFAEEIVRDLAERGVVTGSRGSYICQQDSATVRVPATLQAAIAARIDRLGPSAKRTINAAAVLGMRFDAHLLNKLVDSVAIAEVLEAELVDQVMFTPRAEYSFRHPLIRTVAYVSQLKSDRSQLHRRLADAIRHDSDSDANAALIAAHLESAGDLATAYEWHMRAAAAAGSRDVRAARISWRHAAHVADRLPADHPDGLSMRTVPRTLFCGNAWREWGSADDPAFDELRELAGLAGDQLSAAFGLAGRLTALVLQDQFTDATRLGSELGALAESLEHPLLTVELLISVSNAKFHAGELADGLRFAQRAIDIVDGDPIAGKLLIGSPLAMALALRGAHRWGLGMPGWQADIDEAIEIARPIDRTVYGMAVMYKYAFPGHNGAVLPGATGLADTAEALDAVGQSSDDIAFWATHLSRGVVLVHQADSARRRDGIDALAHYRGDALRRRPWTNWLRVVDTELALDQARQGNVDGAIVLARQDVSHFAQSGDMTSRGPAYTVLVESLLRRGTEVDRAEARAAIEQLAAVPIENGFVLHELPLLRMRALAANADGDEPAFRDIVDRYRRRANELGFAEHIEIAAGMG